ncbi:MAG: sugar transferase, partial [Pseudomonadota bacterium]
LIKVSAPGVGDSAGRTGWGVRLTIATSNLKPAFVDHAKADRMVVESELKHYGVWVKHYLSVRPGLTGPWQIGGRSDDSYEERVRKDVSYVDNWGLRSDAMIVLRTAGKFLALNTSGAR